MAKGKKAVEISPERVAEIIADGRSGRNWASELNMGPACVCGLRKNGTKDAATCYRPGHPLVSRES